MLLFLSFSFFPSFFLLSFFFRLLPLFHFPSFINFSHHFQSSLPPISFPFLYSFTFHLFLILIAPSSSLLSVSLVQFNLTFLPFISSIFFFLYFFFSFLLSPSSFSFLHLCHSVSPFPAFSSSVFYLSFSSFINFSHLSQSSLPSIPFCYSIPPLFLLLFLSSPSLSISLIHFNLTFFLSSYFYCFISFPSPCLSSSLPFSVLVINFSHQF